MAGGGAAAADVEDLADFGEGEAERLGLADESQDGDVVVGVGAVARFGAVAGGSSPLDSYSRMALADRPAACAARPTVQVLASRGGHYRGTSSFPGYAA